MTLSSGTSAVISCASVSERIHSSSSKCFEVGSFSFIKKMSCVLRRNRHSSSKSPVAHLIVRMSGPRNKRPAKETMASKCSCRSLVCPGALMGVSLTCGSNAIPVLLRPCSQSRSVPLCTFHHHKQSSPPRHFLQWWNQYQCPSFVE